MALPEPYVVEGGGEAGAAKSAVVCVMWLNPCDVAGSLAASTAGWALIVAEPVAGAYEPDSTATTPCTLLALSDVAFAAPRASEEGAKFNLSWLVRSSARGAVGLLTVNFPETESEVWL